MSTGKPRDAGKERFWRRMVHQWHRSGLSAGDFCAERGLSTANFYSWRRTLYAFDEMAFAVTPWRPELFGHVRRVAGRYQVVLGAVEEQERRRRA